MLGNCILCGKFDKLTKEHIFAQWIEKVVPSTFTETKADLITAEGYRSKIIPEKHSDLGANVLCDDCNNNWGSRLQNKTKIVLEPLIKGQWFNLNNNNKEQLAKWLTCFVMVREFLHPELVTISSEERKRFRKHSIPSQGTSMWIVPFDGTKNHLAAWHRAFKGLTIQKPSPIEPPDSHFTVLGISKILFFIFGTTNEEFLNKQSIFRFAILKYLKSKGMTQIWPLGASFPTAKPESLRDEHFDHLIPGAWNAISEPTSWIHADVNLKNTI